MFFKKAVIVHKTAKEVNKYITEPGTDGRLLRMQMTEIMNNVEDNYINEQV